MNDILICKNCGSRIKSPISGTPGSISGSPQTMTMDCPKCGNKVDVLYD